MGQRVAIARLTSFDMMKLVLQLGMGGQDDAITGGCSNSEVAGAFMTS